MIVCENGPSITALAASGAESTSPKPVIPASVVTRTISASWPLSHCARTCFCETKIASTLVIFMG